VYQSSMPVSHSPYQSLTVNHSSYQPFGRVNCGFAPDSTYLVGGVQRNVLPSVLPSIPLSVFEASVDGKIFLKRQYQHVICVLLNCIHIFTVFYCEMFHIVVVYRKILGIVFLWLLGRLRRFPPLKLAHIDLSAVEHQSIDSTLFPLTFTYLP